MILNLKVFLPNFIRCTQVTFLSDPFLYLKFQNSDTVDVQNYYEISKCKAATTFKPPLNSNVFFSVRSTIFICEGLLQTKMILFHWKQGKKCTLALPGSVKGLKTKCLIFLNAWKQMCSVKRNILTLLLL